MNRNVLFGVTHGFSKNGTPFIRGLFEAEGHFFYLSPETFRVSAITNEEIWFPEIGELIAFAAFFTPDQESSGDQIYDEIPGIKQSQIYKVIAIKEKPLPVMPRNLLGEKHQSLDLIEAVKGQDVGEVETLLNQGADANSQDGNGNSALLHAVGQRNTQIADILILFAADPYAENKAGVSAKSLATERFSSVLPLFKKADIHLATVGWLKKWKSQPLEDFEGDGELK